MYKYIRQTAFSKSEKHEQRKNDWLFSRAYPTCRVWKQAKPILLFLHYIKMSKALEVLYWNYLMSFRCVKCPSYFGTTGRMGRY